MFLIKIIKTPYGDGNCTANLALTRLVVLKSLKPRMGTETVLNHRNDEVPQELKSLKPRMGTETYRMRSICDYIH